MADCKRCGGTGSIPCHDPHVSLKNCRKCLGTGSRRCPNCGGSGSAKKFVGAKLITALSIFKLSYWGEVDRHTVRS
jgi:DnaJ-class molecular chaperone